MSLVNITDFDQALILLGLYEREVMRTDILDYPAQWPKPPSQPPVKTEPKPIEEKIAQIPVVKSPEPNSPPPAPPLVPNNITNNTDNSTVIINEASPVSNLPVESVPAIPEIPELLYEAQRKTLLTEQEKERRLFYLFVQELERTGDLRKLPAVLHAPSRP